ncbi:hypothetical protein SEVIR_9G504750v4 [Setaria viridis]
MCDPDRSIDPRPRGARRGNRRNPQRDKMGPVLIPPLVPRARPTCPLPPVAVALQRRLAAGGCWRSLGEKTVARSRLAGRGTRLPWGALRSRARTAAMDRRTVSMRTSVSEPGPLPAVITCERWRRRVAT